MTATTVAAVASPARMRWEVLAVFASAGLHFATTLWQHWRAVDQVVLGLGWLGYVVWRARTPGVLAHWGMQRAGFAPSARAAARTPADGDQGAARGGT